MEKILSMNGFKKFNMMNNMIDDVVREIYFILWNNNKIKYGITI